MNYAALKAEAALPEYAGMTRAQKAAAIRAKAVTIHRDVPTSEARSLLLATGEWGALVMLARMQPSQQVPAEAIAAAITAEDTLRLTQVLEVAQDGPRWTAVQTLLGGLVAAGTLSDDTRNALLALRTVTTTRDRQLGFHDLTEHEIAAAEMHDG